MATNTEINVGIRRNFATLGDRNYEPGGGALYTSSMEDLEYAGTKYDTDEQIPYDAVDHYSDDDLMELYFNAGMVHPTT